MHTTKNYILIYCHKPHGLLNRVFQVSSILYFVQVNVMDGSEKTYEFDGVLDSNCSQAEVYKRVVQPLVLGVQQGYNATVLAYGQTGSGKTYTMGTATLPPTNEVSGNASTIY